MGAQHPQQCVQERDRRWGQYRVNLCCSLDWSSVVVDEEAVPEPGLSAVSLVSQITHGCADKSLRTPSLECPWWSVYVVMRLQLLIF